MTNGLHNGQTVLQNKHFSRKILIRFLLLFTVLTFILLFFYIPVFGVLKGAFLDKNGSFSLSNLRDVLTTPYNRRVILFTFEQAVLSTFFAVLLGFPGAYILAKVNFPGKSAVKAVSMIPFVLPSILVVLGFVIFFGNNGYLNRAAMMILGTDDPPFRILYSLKAIILAHSFYNFPIAMRILSSLWEKMSSNQQNAAFSLGANRETAFFTVTLPQLMPAVLSAAGIIFLFCFSSFAVILVLGGGPAYSTMEVEIYRLAKVSLDVRAASSLAVIGIFFSLLFMYLTIHLQKKTSNTEDMTIAPPQEKPKGITRPVLITTYVVFIVFLVGAPIISVIVKSFQMPVSRAGSEVLSLHWYQKLLPGSPGAGVTAAIRNSIIFALSSAAIAIPVGTILSYFSVKNWIGNRTVTSILDSLLMLPMIVSSVMLGLGYMILKNSFPDRFSDSGILIIFAHSIIAYPFVIRSVTGVLRKIKPSLIHAASSMGASPASVFFTIELPLIKNALLTGAAFAFALSMGELNATILLAGKETTTIPVAIYRLIGSYNFYGACALGTVLIGITVITFILLDRISLSTGRNLPWV